jgi:RQC domain-containing protein
MTRRVHRVPIHLDPSGVRWLPHTEVAAILRGADDLILRGGRTLLAKILRGSREKRLLELGLDRSPVHGYYRGLHDDEVMARIDWVIEHGYLDVHYDYRLPLLVYTPAGWEIEKETRARELLAGFDAMLAAGPPYPVEGLKDRNRQVIWRLLELVQERGTRRYAPILEAWQAVDYRKVRQAIARILRHAG